MAIFQDSYKKLINVPKRLSEEMYLYDEKCSKIRKDYDDECTIIQENYQKAEADSVNMRDIQIEEADEHFEEWKNKNDQYLEASRLAGERTEKILGKIFRLENPITTSEAKDRFDLETESRQSKRKENDNEALIASCIAEEKLRTEIRDLSRRLRTESGTQRDAEKENAGRRFRLKHDANDQRKDCELRSSARKKDICLERAESEFVERVEGMILPDKFLQEYKAMENMQPNYDLFETAKDFPEGIQFGVMGYDITHHLKDDLKNAVLSSRFQNAIRQMDGRTYLTVPYGHAFTSDRFSTLIEFEKRNRDQAAESLRNLVYNLFMSIPVNRCWCTFVDPVKQGTTFSVFKPLGENDEGGRGDERVIDSKIWYNEKDIEEHLKLIVEHMADVTQVNIQGRYDNIIEYNKEAGINAEPLRFLVIMDFPQHFSNQALKYLESIVDNGPKLGVYTIIAADKDNLEYAGQKRDFKAVLSRIKNVVSSNGDVLCVQEETKEGKMRYFPFAGPTSEQSDKIIREIRKHVGEKKIITYPMVSKNLPAKPDYWFHKSARDGISVPIGMEGAGKTVNLEFGSVFNSFCTLIGGVTGIGKSETIHTIIHSVIFNYSADDVQIYLLDFKNGVSAQRYADYKLANFRVIAVDTEPEFGLAVLQELHNELERRGAIFRSTGVQSIVDYWKYKGKRGESHSDMPRILVIFDEVQTLLDDRDDPIKAQCAAFIKEIVTQGSHAFGMHLIMATQTFELVKCLDKGVYDNIHTRIVMNSTRDAAAILLNDDNDITERIVKFESGQAVINTNIGHKDANRIIRIAYIEDKLKDDWMKQVHEKQEEVMMQKHKPRILLAGPEDDSENPLSVFAETGECPEYVSDPAYHLYIGESLTMINSFRPRLSSARRQNILLAGRDRNQGALTRMFAGYSALSLLLEEIRLNGEITAPFITVFDLNGNTWSADFDMFGEIVKSVPKAFRIFPRNQIIDGIETLYSELSEGRRHFVIFYGLNRAKQLTTGIYERSPKEKLEELFKRGPENGMNFLVWANDPGMFIDSYASSLQWFDYRLAFGMEDKEYRSIIGEPGSKNESKLDGTPRMNAISFDMTGDNQKVRMYERPTKGWLNKFLDNVKKFVR